MKKYVTVDRKNDNGLCYRKISEIMTKEGDKMNHMTVLEVEELALIHCNTFQLTSSHLY